MMVQMRPFTPDPEPVFVLKASDALALGAFTQYQVLCEVNTAFEKRDEVLRGILDFQLWQERNPQKVKMPEPVTSAHESATVGSYLAAATAAFRDQVSTANTTRAAPNADTPNVRGMGADRLAAGLGLEHVRATSAGIDSLEPWPENGGGLNDFMLWTVKSINALISLCVRHEAELQRLLRLMGDPAAEPVDLPHGQETASAAGRRYPQAETPSPQEPHSR